MFILEVCNILKKCKNNKISEILEILKDKFSDILSNQICDLLYNNINNDYFENKLYNLIKPI